MSKKQGTQRQKAVRRISRKRHRRQNSEIEGLLSPHSMVQAENMPAGKSSKSLRQSAILKAQKSRGNAYVQRLLEKNGHLKTAEVGPAGKNGQAPVTAKPDITPAGSAPTVQRGLWGWIKKAAKKVGGWVSKGVKAIGKGLAGLGKAIGSGAKKAAGWLKKGLGKAGKWLKKGAGAAWGGLKKFAKKSWGGLKALGKKLGKGVSVVWGRIKSTAQAVFGGAKSLFKSAWGKIKSVGKRIVSGSKSLFKKAVGGIKSIGKSIWGSIKKAVGAVKGAAKKIYSKVKGGLKKAWSKIKGFGKSLINKIKKGLSKAWKTLKKLAKMAWTGLKWVGKQLWSKLKGIYHRTVNWFKKLPTRLKRLFLHLWKGVKSFKPWSLSWWKKLGKLSTWKDFLLWTGEALIYLLEAAGVGELYETAADLLKFNTRPLSGAEIAKAQTVFGNSIPYEKVRVDEAALLGPSWTKRAYVSFNTINTWGKINDHTLIHELTHVWQYNQMGAIYMPKALHAQEPEDYKYGGVAGLRKRQTAGLPFTSFKLEQQGDILADYYRDKANGSLKGADLATYEHFVNQVKT